MMGVIFLKLLELLQLCLICHQDKFYYVIFLRMKIETHIKDSLKTSVHILRVWFAFWFCGFFNYIDKFGVKSV